MLSSDARQVLAHYLVMILLVFVVTLSVRFLVGDPGLVVEAAIVFGIVFAYRPVIRRLGFVPVPDLWQREQPEE